MFAPRLMPLTTMSGGHVVLRPSESSATQSAGLPPTA
jgi:hypothetical protein